MLILYYLHTSCLLVRQSPIANRQLPITMTIPTLLFAFVIALLIGSLFHAIRGGGGGRFLLNLLFSTLGFALGQAAGWWFRFALYAVGDLDIALGAIGSLLILSLGDWLSRIKPADKSSV